MLTQTDALDAIERAWPYILIECRKVLGSELHYQAMLYHCLRVYGLVPAEQLGMNVKMWIDAPKTELFQKLDKRKHEDFQGGFETIPDVVLFSPDVAGDWRRRQWASTSRQMLAAIEVKASERRDDRLTRVDVVGDIEKLAAHREEVQHLGADFAPVVLVVDTAPLKTERMRDEVILEAREVAEANSISLFYLSQDEDLVFRAPVDLHEKRAVSNASRRPARKKQR